MKKSIYVWAGLAVLSACLWMSCTKPTSSFNAVGGGLPTHYIRIVNGSYSPSYLKVAMGSSITFVNLSSSNHTVVSDNGVSLVSPTLAPGTSYFYKKDTVGTIGYHCVENPSIRGVIEYRP